MPAIPPLRPRSPSLPLPEAAPPASPRLVPFDLPGKSKGKAKSEPIPATPSELNAGGVFADKPVTVDGKPINVRWHTAKAYSYKADVFPDAHSMLDHPQGLKSYHGAERKPKRIESVPRESGDDHADGSGDGVLRRKEELKHYLSEFGPGAVQQQLSFLPSLVRRPSVGELFVMQDFAKSVHQYSRLSQGKRGPKTGEFIGTYANVTDKDTGAKRIERTNFKYNPGPAIDVPQQGAPHDYVIHSHPYDPKVPLAAGIRDPLGGAYPSGQDRLMARTTGKGGQPPPKELMMHGGQTFHTHGHDLHFSLLDPTAAGTLHLADPSKGPGWDDALYIGPADRPPRPGIADVTDAAAHASMSPAPEVSPPASPLVLPESSGPAPGSSLYLPRRPEPSAQADDNASTKALYGGD